MTGVKHDGGKLRASLLPGWRAMAPVIRVLQAGQKDGRESHGWQNRPVEEHVEAMHRHWLQCLDDPNSTDADDGESHLAHAIARGLFVLWHESRAKESVVEPVEAGPPTLDVCREFLRQRFNGGGS